MGNYRFRLSDLIPSSWFYKLKENNKTRKSQHKSSSSPSPVAVAVAEPKSHLSDHRKSYHFTRDLTLISSNSPLKPRISDRQYSPVEPPRRSSRRRRSTKRNRPPQRFVTSSVSANSSCRVSLESTFTKPPGESPSLRDLDQTSSSDYDSISPECGSVRGLTPDTFDGMLSCSTSCRCSIDNDTVSEHDHLPPIITKKLQEPTKIPIPSSDFSERSAYVSLSVKVMKEDFSSTASTTSSSRDHQNKRITSLVRRHSPKALSPGLRLRMNSPRIGNLRIQARKNTTMSSNPSSGSRRSVSDSFAVMKSSKDPQRDFRESMLEMIVENNIRVSKDLEELLACYLSLNSDEYHDLIINVFKQIWFEFLHVRLK